ncbi:MAG: dihydrolipoyl dehydrogenase [Clostridia bacterium]
MELYDLIVIGGGPGGYLAAERSATAKLKTLIIEKREFGGVCLNEGCIPSKSLLHCGKVLDYIKHADGYGITVGEATLSQAEVVKRKNKVVRILVAGVKSQLKESGAVMVKGEAYIEGKDGDGITIKCGDEHYKTKYLIIATGSAPVIPPILGLKEGIENGFALTNKEVLDLKEAPNRFCVIGGGVIGLEMAAYYATIGSQVTVVEMLNKIAGATDESLSTALQESLTKKGINFILGAKVVKINNNSVDYELNGEVSTVEADKTLLCIGRRAVTTGFGLENLSVDLTRGAIVTDSQMRTNVENVFAVGDVNGKVMLAHTAYREAEVAVNTILGIRDEINYNCIPSVIYTVPEVASAGETENTAIAKGLKIKVTQLPMTYSGRFVAENNSKDGFIKLIINVESNKLIGIQIIGAYAGEIISAASSLIDLEVDVDRIKRLIFPHPTVCELIHEAINK